MKWYVDDRSANCICICTTFITLYTYIKEHQTPRLFYKSLQMFLKKCWCVGTIYYSMDRLHCFRTCMCPALPWLSRIVRNCTDDPNSLCHLPTTALPSLGHCGRLIAYPGLPVALFLRVTIWTTLNFARPVMIYVMESGYPHSSCCTHFK